jgi:hypothetical protein
LLTKSVSKYSSVSRCATTERQLLCFRTGAVASQFFVFANDDPVL